MSNQIWINYQKTLQQAEKLEKLAVQMRELSTKEIGENLQEIDAAWNGESGEIYCQKGRRINSIIYQRSKKLSEAARVLRNNAAKLYRAEQAAINIVLMK